LKTDNKSTDVNLELERELIMSAIFKKIINHKMLILIILCVLTVVSFVLSRIVSVNFELTDYLPDSAQSTISMKEMNKEFQQDIPNLKVMVSNVSISEAVDYKERLAGVDGVKKISWLDDVASLAIPLEMQGKETIENWYKDGNAIYTIRLGKDKEAASLTEIRNIIGDEGAMSGSGVNLTETKKTSKDQVGRMMTYLIPFILLILLLTTSSWFEPILFLITIGVAIVLNTGTNVVFGEISFITQTSCGVLQLAVSLDYSIFLLHRFAEYRNQGLDVENAMAEAFKKSFSSIISSGLTTIIGFAALILMRFKIGPDMGWVMAKGIVFSLLTVLILLPILGILCYKIIDKTHHRSLLPALNHFKKVVLKSKIPILIVFVIITVPAFLAQSSNTFLFGTSKMVTDESSQVFQDSKKIDQMFGKSNQMVLMVPKGNFANEKSVNTALKKIPEVSSVISYIDNVGSEIPMEFVPESLASKLISENYSRMVVTVDTDTESDEAFAVVLRIRDIAQEYYSDSYYLAGETVTIYDMKTVTMEDNTIVNLIAIGAVALVLLVMFKSLLLPVLLVLVIEGSIWLNLSISYFAKDSLFFIVYLIISSVQLGATVDYAILFANRFIENRACMLKNDAVMQTIKNTTVSILTSALILTAAGLLLGVTSSSGVSSQLGYLIGRGAIISALFVLFVLPALLWLFDKPIQHTMLKSNFMIGPAENHVTR
jgi:predicted RND superfamily exporter protein